MRPEPVTSDGGLLQRRRNAVQGPEAVISVGSYEALVCLAAGVPDLHDAIDRALAPHHAYWRSWSIDADVAGRAGNGLRALQDLEARRDAAAARTREAWHFWQELLVVYPPPAAMADLRGTYETEPDAFIRSRLEAEYRAQPAISAIWALAGIGPGHTVFDTYPGHSRLLERSFVRGHDVVRHFDRPEPELLAMERTRALSIDALVTQEGRWIETPEPHGAAADNTCLMGEGCFDLSVLQPYYSLLDDYLSAILPEALVVPVHFTM